ncbi:MAG: SCO family protein [Bdellovibrionales bacterium]|nr:SCO family protein [Bdellovibrionales bacterium]
MGHRLALFVITFGCLIALGTLATRVQQHANREALPKIAPAPEFELIDSQNHSFQSSSLAGSVYVVHFFFTSCRGPCPITGANVAALQQQFASNPRVRFVSISVDPSHDTTEVLQLYASQFGADPRHWTFLTGSRDDISTIAVSGFKVGVDTNASPIVHTTKLVLVDHNGIIRGYFDGTDDQSVETLKAAISDLA